MGIGMSTLWPKHRYRKFVVSTLAALLASILLVTACRGQIGGKPDLYSMAAEMLPRLEVLSGLEARAPIKLSWQGRAEMQEYVNRQLEEELTPDHIEGVR